MQNALLAVSDKLPAHLAGLGSLGNENIGSDTLATPRLYLLQALSDQVVKGNPNYIPDASSGMFLNSISNELYDELWVSNLFMTRLYNVNKKRIFGVKEWKGTFPTVDEAVAKLTADGCNVADYDITDTHIHTLAIVDPVSGRILTPVQYSMKGTALRESRSWNSNIVTQGSNVPRFAGVWKMTSKLNTNNKGSWYTPQFSFAGWAPSELYAELNTLFQGLRPQGAAINEADFG